MSLANRLNFRWLILVLPAMLLLAACAQPSAPAPDVEISQPIYRFGEVADQVWVLVGYDDALNPTVVEEGTVITAEFSSSDGQVTGSGGCNSYFAAYTADDEGEMTIDGPIGATMMACETGAEQEAAYLAALETVTAWALNDEGRLELTYDSGRPYEQKLVYIPGETPLTGIPGNWSLGATLKIRPKCWKRRLSRPFSRPKLTLVALLRAAPSAAMPPATAIQEATH